MRLIFGKQESCARHSELVIVPSADMRRVVREAYPWRTEHNVLVFPWGLLGGDAVCEDTVRARRRLRLPEDRPVLVALSRIAPEKGHDLLLKALRLWEKRGGRPLYVVICGAPSFIHGQRCMQKLLRLAGKLRHTEVRFVGYVSGQAKLDHLAAADLYVFPSRHESYGLTLVEAMGHGLPVLTTDHRSAGELVPPEFGRVTPPTAEGLARGMEELLGGDADLRAMGQKASRHVHRRSFEDTADRLAAELQRLRVRT